MVCMGGGGGSTSLKGSPFRVLSVKVKDGYIDDMFSLWDSNRQEINLPLNTLINRSHPTFKFTAEIWENKTTFLNTAN